jgi:amicoumacin kinase
MEVPAEIRLEGAARFAVDPDSFKSLNGTDGAVYLCRRGERAHVIKFVPMPHKHLRRWEERQAFVAYLAGRGVRIACPEPSIQGNLYERLNAGDEQYVVVLMPQAAGRTIEARYPEWNPQLFQAWGRTIGKMHALAQQFPLWRREEPDSVADAFDENTPDDHMMDWRMEHASFARWCSDPDIVQHWLPLREKLARLPVERSSYGAIHNDLHQWNFLYKEGQGEGIITIVDFDVCSYHWFMTDIAIALYHAMLAGGGDTPASRAAFTERFLPPFRQGYEQENQLAPWWWGELNTFLKYRQILVYVALSNSWPEQHRAVWQTSFLGKMRKAILGGKPVLPETFVRALV